VFLGEPSEPSCTQGDLVVYEAFGQLGQIWPLRLGLDLAKARDRNLTLQSNPQSFFALRDGNHLKIFCFTHDIEGGTARWWEVAGGTSWFEHSSASLSPQGNGHLGTCTRALSLPFLNISQGTRWAIKWLSQRYEPCGVRGLAVGAGLNTLVPHVAYPMHASTSSDRSQDQCCSYRRRNSAVVERYLCPTTNPWEKRHGKMCTPA
jgi:hypothetical protein